MKVNSNHIGFALLFLTVIGSTILIIRHQDQKDAATNAHRDKLEQQVATAVCTDKLENRVSNLEHKVNRVIIINLAIKLTLALIGIC